MKFSLKLAALLTVATLLGAFLQPAPTALRYNLIARLEYTRQSACVVLGLCKDYNLQRLHAAYSLFGFAAPPKPFKGFDLTPLPNVIDAREVNSMQILEAVRSAFGRNEPIAVRGMLHNDNETFLPSTQKWGAQFVLDTFGSTRIPVFTNMTNDKSAVYMPMNKFYEQLVSEAPQQYARCIDDLHGAFASGTNLTRLADIMASAPEYHANFVLNGGPSMPCLFVGGKHVKTRLHSDMGNSAFVNIQGRKRWTMFPATESMYLLPAPHQYNVAYNSRLNIFAEKEEIAREYPYASQAKGWEIVLQPGDLLFFPAFTWHGVENLDTPTVALDNPVISFLSSITAQPMLTMGTSFNPFTLAKIASTLYKGQTGAIKRVFFEGYLLEDAESPLI